MASTIQIKRGTGSAVPSGLADGELAINLDSGKLYFGSGSTSVDNFTFGELTAEKYIVSSSVLYVTTSFSSGSTEFGDTADDTHTFTGAITASGNISASGTITANTFTGNGLSINGSSNSHIEVGEYPVGYDTLGLNTLHITGSGLIISGAMADANHHNMLKIGDVELLDVNTAITKNQFLIHNVKSFAITSGSDVGSIVASAGNTLFKHDGDSFFICKGGENTANATIKSSGTTTSLTDTTVQIDASVCSIKAPNSTPPYIMGFEANPNSNPQVVKSIEAANIFPALGGAVTASAVSSSGDIAGNTITVAGTDFINLHSTGYRVNSGAGPLNLFGNITASGNVSSSGTITAEHLLSKDDAVISDSLSVGGNTFLGTHDGSDSLYINRHSSGVPYGEIKIGEDDYDVPAGLRITTRNDAGTAEVALTINGSDKGVTFTGEITASGHISSSANLYALDYFDNGANINTIYSPIASPTFTGTVAIPNIANVSASIAANTTKVTNVSTNLTATTHASQITINSSDGDNVVIAEASDSIAGVMTVAHHDKLDGIEASATADQTQADINGLAITTVGALGSGTIAPGFGNIDNGSSTLDTGALTATTLTVPSRVFADPGTNAGDHTAGDVWYFGNVSTVAGAIYYLNSSGTWSKANADAEADGSGMLAVALGGNSTTNGMLLRGFVTLAADIDGTEDHGVKVYLKATDGLATVTPPSTDGHIVRIIGYSIHNSDDAIYFNPSNDYIEHS